MSKWYEVKDADHISLSEDEKSVQILFAGDDYYSGNTYVEAPTEIIAAVLPQLAALRAENDKLREALEPIREQLRYIFPNDPDDRPLRITAYAKDWRKLGETLGVSYDPH